MDGWPDILSKNILIWCNIHCMLIRPFRSKASPDHNFCHLALQMAWRNSEMPYCIWFVKTCLLFPKARHLCFLFIGPQHIVPKSLALPIHSIASCSFAVMFFLGSIGFLLARIQCSKLVQYLSGCRSTYFNTNCYK